MSILVTGGTGYIGSHTCVELLQAGYDVVIIDNLSNSDKKVLRRINAITKKQVTFYKGDILDDSILQKIFCNENIEAVIHFAGLKAVGESTENPLKYYHNNVAGTISLCKVMQEHAVKRIIFSSSATVYGEQKEMPIKEDCLKGKIMNPYGQTKAMLEQILVDVHSADPEWNVVLLRYFNPVGAHESGLIGEDPKGKPNNLMPYIAQVAVGRQTHLNVFGDDYDTPDGTGVRDYIHVMDLAKGHVKAMQKIQPGVSIYNLGTGKGYSVLDMLHTYEKVCGKKLPYKIQVRRAGDLAVCYCDASKAEDELGWKAERTLEDMCTDSWRWQSQNPNGYDNE